MVTVVKAVFKKRPAVDGRKKPPRLLQHFILADLILFKLTVQECEKIHEYIHYLRLGWIDLLLVIKDS